MKDWLDQVEPRQLLLIMGGSLVLLLSALVVYGLVPPVKEYRAATESRAVLQQAAQAGEGVTTQLETLREEIEALERRLHGDAANLPDRQLEAFVIGRLQNISWSNQVELVAVTPRAGGRFEMFNESLFDIELYGSYRGVFDWLSGVGDELGFVVIKEYEMRPAENVPRDPRLHVELTLASYRVSAS